MKIPTTSLQQGFLRLLDRAENPTKGDRWFFRAFCFTLWLLIPGVVVAVLTGSPWLLYLAGGGSIVMLLAVFLWRVWDIATQLKAEANAGITSTRPTAADMVRLVFYGIGAVVILSVRVIGFFLSPQARQWLGMFMFPLALVLGLLGALLWYYLRRPTAEGRERQEG